MPPLGLLGQSVMSRMKIRQSWPKTFPPLSEEQERISNDFMRYWHEVLPRQYGIVDKFNHQYVVKNAPASFVTTLEVGAGLGEHLDYEKLTDLQASEYVALDIRANMIEELQRRYPKVVGAVADCQKQLPYEDDFFDRVLAIHVLEHLPDLPAAVRELYRVCNKRHGVLSVVIPCEGGFAYGIARRISAKRIFERRYNQSYDWFIEREHISIPDEILFELSNFFDICSSTYFPIPLKFESLNLCIGLTLKPKCMH